MTEPTAHSSAAQSSAAQAAGAPPSGAPPVVPAPLSDAVAVAAVAAATWRELARRRRLLSLGALLLLPVLLLMAVKIWYPGEVDPEVLMALLASEVYILFLLPVTALAVGAPAISEPIAEGTLVYFWTRPLRRRALYLGRILAAALVACVMVLLSQTAVFATLVAGGFGAFSLDMVRLHAEMTVVTLLGTLAYTALFGMFGAVVQKPIIPALIFAFGWETLVSGIPQRIQEWTLRFHLRNLVHWPDAEPADLRGVLEALLSQALQREPVPEWRSVLVLLVVLVATSVLGVLALQRRQLDRQG